VCETWPFTVSKEHSLKFAETKALRSMFGFRKKEITKYILKNLSNFYSSSNITRVIRVPTGGGVVEIFLFTTAS
jgi:hypothetical protein